MTHDEIMLAVDDSRLTPVMEMFQEEVLHFAKLVEEAERRRCEDAALVAWATIRDATPFNIKLLP